MSFRIGTGLAILVAISFGGHGAVGKPLAFSAPGHHVMAGERATGGWPLQMVSSKGHRTIGNGGDGRAIRNDYFPDLMISVPVEAYPTPGLCRVWYPDRSPFIQPPVSDCGVPVPRGAILIIG